jgi:rhamnogalacturonan endolyase
MSEKEQAWANGGKIGDVTTVSHRNDIKTKAGSDTKLGNMQWKTQERQRIWQSGKVDRKASEFKHSGPPYEHARITKCPANATFTIGKNTDSEWCFAQSEIGTYSIQFDIPFFPVGNKSPAAILSVSLTAYSSVTSSSITVNNSTIGNLEAGKPRSDSSMMRSGTVAGEWRYVEYPIRT